MKTLLKIAYLLVAVLTVNACKNGSDLFGGHHSPIVDTLKFKDGDVANVAYEMDDFINEELKADKDIDSYSSSDKDALVKKLKAEMDGLKIKIDSATSKLSLAVSKLPRNDAAAGTPEAKEYFKWLKFLSEESKKADSVKNKSLQF
ncbi:MAG: hypothetical protein ACHQIM_18010 [Sphingobacteriales bacterium]